MQNRRQHHLLIPPFLRYDQVKNKLLGFSVSLSRSVNSIDGRHTCFTMLTGHSCSSDLLISFTWLHNFFTPDSHFLAPWVFSVLGSRNTNPRKGRLPHHFFCHKGFGRWLVHHFSSWWVGASKHWKWKCYFSMEVFTLKMPLKWRNFQVSSIFWKNSCVFFSKCHTCPKVVLSNRTISNTKHGSDRTLSASIIAGRYRSAKTASHMAWCLMIDPPKNQEEPLFTIFAFCHVFNKKSRNDPSAKIVTQPLPPSQTFKFDLSPNFCGLRKGEVRLETTATQPSKSAWTDFSDIFSTLKTLEMLEKHIDKPQNTRLVFETASTYPEKPPNRLSKATYRLVTVRILE